MNALEPASVVREFDELRLGTAALRFGFGSAAGGALSATRLVWITVALLSLIQISVAAQEKPIPVDANRATVKSSTGAARDDAKAEFSPSLYKTFAEWKRACDRLPSNRVLGRRMPPRALLPLKTFKEFAEPLDAFLRMSKEGVMARNKAWLGEAPAMNSGFFHTASAYFSNPAIPFQPFAQRLVIPPGSHVLFHGDFHGDVRSLIAWLDWLQREKYLRDFKLTRPDVYMVLLGDYTDRGFYGIEVLYTVLRLELENPERMVILRGNHEDVSLATKYGFLFEVQSKYDRNFDLTRLMRLYDFLPVALYLGCEGDFIQCNHGGMEPGYDPRALLAAAPDVQFQFLGMLRQRQFAANHLGWAQQLDREGREIADQHFKDFQPRSATDPTVLGFMWNDFSVTPGQPAFRLDPDRAFIYGESATRFILEQASTSNHRLHAVFRAHQHSSLINPMMRRLKAGRGLFRHWQSTDALELLGADERNLADKIEHDEERSLPSHSVWTFNVAPDTVYGEGCDFGFDTFGVLTVARTFPEWKLRVVNLPTVK